MSHDHDHGTDPHGGAHHAEKKPNLILIISIAIGLLIIVILGVVYIPKWFDSKPYKKEYTQGDIEVTTPVSVNLSEAQADLVTVTIPKAGEVAVVLNAKNGRYEQFRPSCTKEVTFIDEFGNDCPFQGTHFKNTKPDPSSGSLTIQGDPGTVITFKKVKG